MTTEELQSIKPRHVSLQCIAHPEWGTFGVMEDRGGYFEIYGSKAGGARVLDKSEALEFWELVKK